MRPVSFRYGFHPEGFDPLDVLHRCPANQPAKTLPCTEPQAPQVVTSPRAPVFPPPSGQGVPGGGNRSRWTPIRWAAVVLASLVVAGSVWAWDHNTGQSQAPAKTASMTSPVVLEPDALPVASLPNSPLSAAGDARPSSASLVAAASPGEPSRDQGSQPSANPQPTPAPVPSASPDLPVPSLPSVTLPPVTWTKVPAEPEPSAPPVQPAQPPQPSVTVADEPPRRPSVTVRPERKPSLKVPSTKKPERKPSADQPKRPRTPSVQPRVKPAVRSFASSR